MPADIEKDDYYYRVTLKSGEVKYFTNDNNYPSYEDILWSGKHAVTNDNGTQMWITSDNIARIDKIPLSEYTGA